MEIASRETIKSLALQCPVVNDFQALRVLTSTLWCNSHMSLKACIETTLCGTQVSLRHPLLPTLSLHLFGHELARWGRPNWLCPRARETVGVPCGRSPTPTVNGVLFNPADTDKILDHEDNNSMTRNKRPSKPYSCINPQRFSRGPRSYAFSRLTKHALTSGATRGSSQGCKT